MKHLASALSVCVCVILSGCEKDNLLENQMRQESEPLLSSSSIIESSEAMSNSDLFASIASIKYNANIIPSGNAPSPSYVPLTIRDIKATNFIHLLEATINFDFHATSTPVGEQTSFTKKYTLSKDGSGFFSETQLADTYKDLHALIESNTPDGQSPVITNVWANYDDEDQAEVEVYTTYSELASTSPLGSSDNWYAFDNAGGCVSNPASLGDAASRLSDLANWYGYSAWNGNSNNSTGGLYYACTNGNNLAWQAVLAYADVQGTSVSNNFPMGSCTNPCLSPTQMETQLAQFFTYTSTIIPSGHLIVIVEWESDDQVVDAFHPCYPSDFEYHRVDWTFGVLDCGALPW